MRTLSAYCAPGQSFQHQQMVAGIATKRKQPPFVKEDPMTIFPYKTLPTAADEMVAVPAAAGYARAITDRDAGMVYLYNTAHELVRILHLTDFGFVDRKKAIGHGDRDILVTDGARRHIELQPEQELIACWSEEHGLTIAEFNGKTRFTLPGSYSGMCFDPRDGYLWVARRDGNSHITVLVLDQWGTVLAQLAMDDPLYQSMCLFTPLPDPGQAVLCLAAGQDGSRDSVLQRCGERLEILRTLPDDRVFVSCIADGGEALLVDFDEQVLYRCTFPALAEIGRFAYPRDEPWCVGHIQPFGSDKLLLCNEYDQRYHLLDMASMALCGEVVLEGYEPVENRDGELCSDITSMKVGARDIACEISRRVDGKRQRHTIVARVPGQEEERHGS